jgi:hypothetical protein
MPFLSKRKQVPSQALHCQHCRKGFIQAGSLFCSQCYSSCHPCQAQLEGTESWCGPSEDARKKQKHAGLGWGDNSEPTPTVETVDYDSDCEGTVVTPASNHANIIDMFGHMLFEAAGQPLPSSERNPNSQNTYSRDGSSNQTDTEQQPPTHHGTANNTQQQEQHGETRGGVGHHAAQQQTSQTPNGILLCDNCHRKQPRAIHPELTAEDGVYELGISSCDVARNSLRRKFCNLRASHTDRQRRRNTIRASLCLLCAQYLLSQLSINNMNIVWPAMMWSWLTSVPLSNQHGPQVWSLIPHKWRTWWLDEAQQHNPVLAEVTMLHPLSAFKDVTVESNELRSAIKGGILAELKQKVDEHVQPLVKCPWGCTEFYHKTGTVSLDVTVARCFGVSGLKSVTGNMPKAIQKQVLGIRDDFLHARDDDLYLWNPEWKIKPSIFLSVENGPVVLTCREHIGGGKGRYLHPPLNPHGSLPSRLGDQLAPAVVRPRTIKPVKAHKFSHTFQMHEMRGQFNGVDTLQIADHGRFDQHSKLLQNNESLTIQGRRDIKGMLSRWKEEKKIMPAWLGEKMLARAKDEIPEVEETFESSLSGATFVTLEDAMKLQVMVKNDTGAIVSVPRINPQPGQSRMIQVHFLPSWPKFLTQVHPYNLYGSSPAVVPSPVSAHIDGRVLWFLMGMHACVPAIWDSTTDGLSSSGQWNGWILSYVAQQCYPYLCRASSTRGNPFSFPKKGGRLAKERKVMAVLGMLEEEEAAAAEEDNTRDTMEDASLGSEGDLESYGSVSLGSEEDLESHEESENGSGEGSSTSSSSEMSHNTGSGEGSSASSSSEMFHDGRFHINHLMTLFASHAQVEVVHCDHLHNFMATVISEDLQVVIAIRPDKSVHTPLVETETEDGGGHKWELRFVATSCEAQEGNGNSSSTWDGSMYCRHGGAAFPKWWSLAKNKENSANHVSTPLSPTTPALESWDTAVYVRCKVQTLEHIRDEFLCSMGGQAKVYCHDHDAPLIVAPHRYIGQCCMSAHHGAGGAAQGSADPTGQEVQICKRQIGFQCPVDGCQSHLCLKHHKGIPEQAAGAKFRLRPRHEEEPAAAPVAEENMAVDGISEENSDHQPSAGGGDIWEEESLCSSNADEEPSDPRTNILEGGDAGANGSQSSASSQFDGTLNGPMLDYGSTLQQDMDYDTDFVVEPCMDNAVPDEDGDSLDSIGQNGPSQPYSMPTTNAGGRPLRVIPQGDGRKSVPGHIILNNCGTLLVRRRHKLCGSKRQQNFLQRIVSTSPSKCVPLVYPEAMLFPSIFWKDDSADGAILGAFPNALLADDSTLRKNGFATMQSHVRCRVTNSSLLTSTDERYLCYAFDSLVNLQCRGQDTRVILHRGLTSSKDGPRAAGGDEPIFDTDSVDSRPIVNKLASAVRDKQATYFYTHTANQKDHFGLRRIKEWIDRDDFLDLYSVQGKEGVHDKLGLRAELREAGRRGAAVALLRNWMETAEIWMGYILESSEHPLGKVSRMWWRHEYQDTQGNLSHIHALLWVDDDDHDDSGGGGGGAAAAQDRIRGSVMELIRPGEIDGLVEEGLLECGADIIKVQDAALRILRHICSSRCKRRTGTGNGDLQCRAANNGIENPSPTEHTTKEITVKHSPACCEILHKLGLFGIDALSGKYIPLSDELKATKHYPPAVAGEGVISACCGRLFAATLSSQNLKYVTGYLTSRYLAKYIAMVDEHNRVYVGAAGKDPDTVKLDSQFLHNTKITGSAIKESELRAQRRDRDHPTGRAISMMEVISVLLGYEQVYTNIKFVHVPTVPLEERPAFDQKRPLTALKKDGVVAPDAIVRYPEDLSCSSVIPSYQVRNNRGQNEIPFPRWRMLSNTETMILRDQILSPHSIDATTLFGIRPPELRFVRHQEKYFRWFYRDPRSCKGKKLADVVAHLRLQLEPQSLEKTSWVDGTNCSVYVRPKAVNEIVAYLSTRVDEDFYASDQLAALRDSGLSESPKSITTRFFNKMEVNIQHPPNPNNGGRHTLWQGLKGRLILATSSPHAEMPVVWFNSIKPTQANRWLIHIILSMGEFDNEMNLFGHGTLRECFIQAKLLHPDRVNWESSIENIARRYILEQLVYLPGGSKQFDRNVVAAYQTLTQALVHDTLPINELPSALYTKVRDRASEASKAHMRQMKEALVNTTVADLREKGLVGLPTAEDLLGCTAETPANWTPSLTRLPNQSPESIAEQQTALQDAMSRLDRYQLAGMEQTKSFVVIGGPGVGKSTLLQLFGLCAIARGLCVCMTALMSERARQLGGQHLSQIFCIPVRSYASPTRLAELAIISLCRRPKRMEMLQRIDVLLVDELGQVSAELLAVLDIILRRVRGSSQFMGGVLLMSTMDPLQLHPVKGRPPLLSAHMITCFLFTKLKHSVRASQDGFLRQIQDLTRLHPGELLAPVIRRFRGLIEAHCTFVTSWNDPRLTPDKLRMFGKNRAKVEAEERMLSAMKRRYPATILERRAVDQEASLEGNWKDASSIASRELSKKVKEPLHLTFYPSAHFETTFNLDGHFSQGQLAVLARMPSAEEVASFAPISVLLAPEGCKSMPEDAIASREDLLSRGWREDTVSCAPERTETLGFGLQAKRRQYGLRHRIASTIHAGMGQDLDALVTRVVKEGSKDDQYALWEREQVVVLLSRTHFAKDIYFVGDPEQTSAALAELLLKQSQYSEYILYLLEHLCGDPSPQQGMTLVDHTLNPFRPVDVELPQDDSGFVYILVSLRDRQSTYIGQTKNLVSRFKKHNAGLGAASTSDPLLRPWALLGYITGFEADNKINRLSVESTWQLTRDRNEASFERPLLPDAVADLAHGILQRSRLTTLRYVKCGTFSVVHN